MAIERSYVIFVYMGVKLPPPDGGSFAHMHTKIACNLTTDNINKYFEFQND